MTETALTRSKRPNTGQSLRTKGDAWKSLREFEEAVGGRDALAEIVALAPKDPKQRKILALLGDPARGGDSLASICADAGVHANEMLLLFKDGTFARAYAQSHQIIAERLPQVVEDVAEKASDHMAPCECRVSEAGEFDGAIDPKCPVCRGKGVKFIQGSRAHAELILEAAEMLKTGQGVAVNVQQNNIVNAGDGFFEKLVKGTDDVAYDISDEPVKDERG